VSGLIVLQEPLRALGFRKRSGPIYTVALTPDVLGWLGLNTASRHQPAGTVEVNPVVGVHHRTVEEIVAELRGEAIHPYHPPTVCTPIGDVTPAHRYTAWEIGEVWSAPAAAMLEAVERYGLPYLRSLTDLDAIRVAAEERRGHHLEYRLPVIRQLLGHPRQAWEGLSSDVGALGHRQDPAAQQLRAFARAFGERYGFDPPAIPPATSGK